MIVFSFISVILIFVWIKCTDSDCGIPGHPFGSKVYGYSMINKEGTTITYECLHDLTMFYSRNYERTCIRGLWRDRMPKCAYPQSDSLHVEKYQINESGYESNITEVNINKEFGEINEHDQIILNKSISSVKVFYSPKARISALKLNVMNKPNLLNKIETKLIANLYINKYRKCIETNQVFQNSSSNLMIEFVCEANSYEDFIKEMNDLPNSLIISLNNINHELILVGISVFMFKHNCSDYDIHLNTNLILINGSDRVLLEANKYYLFQSCSFEELKCLQEGNYDKEPSLPFPIIQCDLEELDLKSSLIKNYTLEDFVYFNERKIATFKSTILYYCYENTTKVYRLDCHENSSWIGENHFCRNISNSDDLQGFKSDSRTGRLSSIMIITLASILIFVLIVGLYLFVIERG